MDRIALIKAAEARIAARRAAAHNWIPAMAKGLPIMEDDDADDWLRRLRIRRDRTIRIEEIY